MPGFSPGASRPLDAGTVTATANANTAATAYAQRQPMVSASAGTDSPAISDAIGIEPCLRPNAMPCLSGSACQATSTLDAVRVSAVPVPANPASAHIAPVDDATTAIPSSATA